MVFRRIFDSEQEWQEFYDKIKTTHAVEEIPDKKNPGSKIIYITQVYPNPLTIWQAIGKFEEGGDKTFVDGTYYLRGEKK